MPNYYYQNQWKWYAPSYIRPRPGETRVINKERLEHLRMVHDLRGHKLADALGISVSYLSAILRGGSRGRPMTPNLRAALVNVLRTSDTWLFGEGWGEDAKFGVDDLTKQAIINRTKRGRGRVPVVENDPALVELTQDYKHMSTENRALLCQVARSFARR